MLWVINTEQSPRKAPLGQSLGAESGLSHVALWERAALRQGGGLGGRPRAAGMKGEQPEVDR